MGKATAFAATKLRGVITVTTPHSKPFRSHGQFYGPRLTSQRADRERIVLRHADLDVVCQSTDHGIVGAAGL